MIVDNHFTRQYNPEDSSEHHTRRCENLKSHISRRCNFVIYMMDKLKKKQFSRCT
jgi:hypothetical protein